MNDTDFEIYLEIQEGKLLEDGIIDASTVTWRENPANESTKYHRFDTLINPVLLFAQDFYDFEFNQNANEYRTRLVILTGLQFVKLGRDGIALIIHGNPVYFVKLEIQPSRVELDYFVDEYTPGSLSERTGKFHRFVSKWDQDNAHYSDPL